LHHTNISSVKKVKKEYWVWRTFDWLWFHTRGKLFQV